jgi:hypothetical protein
MIIRVNSTSRRRWQRCWLIVVMLAVIGSPGVRAQDDITARSVEYRFKAVYLLNFLQFMEWPEGTFRTPTSPIIIGVVGANSIASILVETVAGEKIGDHPIEVRRYATLEEANEANVLFVGREERARSRTILSDLASRHVVTVGEADGFAERGGMINFYVEDGKLRFEVNEDTAQLSGVQFSSRLLRLAKIVKTR